MTVGRPDIFGMRFATDRAFDVFLAVVLALCLIGVGALRRGPFGRRLVGMSDSPAACSTVGLSLTVTKLAVFAFSAGLAGLAGALYGGLSTIGGRRAVRLPLQHRHLRRRDTLPGVSLLTGAVLAGVFIAVGPVIGAHIPQIPNFTQLLIGFGVVTIGRNPNGIGRLYAEVTDFWKRRQGRGCADRRPVGRRRSVADGAAATGPSGRRCGPLAELAVEEISVRFGGLQALQDVNLEVHAGAVNGLIGPNGAGKTTLFNVITGLQPPTQGRVRLGGADITRVSPHHRARLGHRPHLPAPRALRHPDGARERADGGGDEASPPHRAPARASKRTSSSPMSGCRTSPTSPPTCCPPAWPAWSSWAGPWPPARRCCCSTSPARASTRRRPIELGRVLVDLADRGMAVLLVEHDMSLVMSICDHVSVLDYGAVIAHGDPATVQADPAVQAAYLGPSRRQRRLPAAASAPVLRRRAPAPPAASSPATAAATGNHDDRLPRPGPAADVGRAAHAVDRPTSAPPTGASRSSTGCPSRSPRARSTPCSAPTGRASRPCSRWRAAGCRRRRAPCRFDGEEIRRARARTAWPAGACAPCPKAAPSSPT